MIKMCQAKATASGAIHELRREFYEQYAEDFQLIKEYEVMGAGELAAKEVEDKAKADAAFVKEQEELRKKSEPNKKGK